MQKGVMGGCNSEMENLPAVVSFWSKAQHVAYWDEANSKVELFQTNIPIAENMSARQISTELTRRLSSKNLISKRNVVLMDPEDGDENIMRYQIFQTAVNQASSMCVLVSKNEKKSTLDTIVFSYLTSEQSSPQILFHLPGEKAEDDHLMDIIYRNIEDALLKCDACKSDIDCVIFIGKTLLPINYLDEHMTCFFHVPSKEVDRRAATHLAAAGVLHAVLNTFPIEDDGCRETQSIVIGIDYGSTNTRMGMVADEVTLFEDVLGEKVTPSYISRADKGWHHGTELLIGKDAKAQMGINHECTACNLKHEMGQMEKDIPKYEKKELFSMMSPQTLTGLFLKKLRESIRDKQISGAVIAVPTLYSSTQRELMKHAGSFAGFKQTFLISDSIAIAIAYKLFEKKSARGNVLIFDMGGGKTDISIVAFHSNTIELKATSSVPGLSGAAVEKGMLSLVEERCGDIKEKHALLLTLEEAKCKFSIGVPRTKVNANDKEIYITNKEIESVLGKYNHSIEDTFQKTCKEAFLGIVGRISDVIFVGGSARIPMIREFLVALVKNSPNFVRLDSGWTSNQIMNQDNLVAIGAAVYGAVRNGTATPEMRQVCSNIKDKIWVRLKVGDTGKQENFTVPSFAVCKIYQDNPTFVVTEMGKKYASANVKGHNAKRFELFIRVKEDRTVYMTPLTGNQNPIKINFTVDMLSAQMEKEKPKTEEFVIAEEEESGRVGEKSKLIQTIIDTKKEIQAHQKKIQDYQDKIEEGRRIEVKLPAYEEKFHILRNELQTISKETTGAKKFATAEWNKQQRVTLAKGLADLQDKTF